MADNGENVAADLTPQQRSDLEYRLITRRFLVQEVLAIGTTLGFLGLLALLIFHAIPPSTQDIIEILIGSFSTAWIMVMSFYFQGAAQRKQMETQRNQETQKVVDTPKS